MVQFIAMYVLGVSYIHLSLTSPSKMELSPSIGYSELLPGSFQQLGMDLYIYFTSFSLNSSSSMEFPSLTSTNISSSSPNLHCAGRNALLFTMFINTVFFVRFIWNLSKGHRWSFFSSNRRPISSRKQNSVHSLSTPPRPFHVKSSQASPRLLYQSSSSSDTLTNKLISNQFSPPKNVSPLKQTPSSTSITTTTNSNTTYNNTSTNNLFLPLPPSPSHYPLSLLSTPPRSSNPPFLSPHDSAPTKSPMTFEDYEKQYHASTSNLASESQEAPPPPFSHLRRSNLDNNFSQSYPTQSPWYPPLPNSQLNSHVPKKTYPTSPSRPLGFSLIPPKRSSARIQSQNQLTSSINGGSSDIGGLRSVSSPEKSDRESNFYVPLGGYFLTHSTPTLSRNPSPPSGIIASMSPTLRSPSSLNRHLGMNGLRGGANVSPAA